MQQWPESEKLKQELQKLMGTISSKCHINHLMVIMIWRNMKVFASTSVAANWKSRYQIFYFWCCFLDTSWGNDIRGRASVADSKEQKCQNLKKIWNRIFNIIPYSDAAACFEGTISKTQKIVYFVNWTGMWNGYFLIIRWNFKKSSIGCCRISRFRV